MKSKSKSFDLVYQGVVFGVAVSLAACTAAALVFGRDAIPAAGIFGVLATFLHQYVGAIRARMAGKGDVWEVKIGGDMLGTMGDAEYARIQMAALRDWRVYLHQACNLGLVIARFAYFLGVAIPVLLAWYVIFLAYENPTVLASAELVPAIRTLLPAVAVCAVMGLGWYMFFGAAFGAVNVFAEYEDDAICRFLKHDGRRSGALTKARRRAAAVVQGSAS